MQNLATQLTELTKTPRSAMLVNRYLFCINQADAVCFLQEKGDPGDVIGPKQEVNVSVSLFLKVAFFKLKSTLEFSN